MKDNRTSQPAAEYDGNIEKTMPYYAAFHERTLDLIEVIKPAPAAWLDTGAGTGTFVKKALARFPEASFVAADPSSAMLKIAKVKLAGADCAFVQQPTEDLFCRTIPLTSSPRFSRITIILRRQARKRPSPIACAC
jgi:tRNA (cmo5U34)-methyltransferase